jgi:putative peptidoglycan lipid II flippase
LGIEPRWGVAGLTISAGIASWVEFTLLQRGIRQRIGQVGVPMGFLAKVWVAALVAAAVGRGLLILFGTRGPILTAAIVLGMYGIVFFALGMAMNLPEAQALTKTLTRKFGAK